MTNFTIDLEKQLSKLGKDLQDLVDRVSPRDKEVHNFHPDADVTESESLYRIEMDLPGMGKDQIRLSMQNRVITIQGERKIELQDGEKLTRSERNKGGFPEPLHCLKPQNRGHTKRMMPQEMST